MVDVPEHKYGRNSLIISIIVVVLILFSIGMIKLQYGGITEPKNIENSDLKTREEIINKIKTSTELVTLGSAEINLGRNQINRMFWGIRNNLTTVEEFKINVVCENSQGNLEIQTFESRFIRETEILPLVVTSNRETELDRYKCIINVRKSDGITYATKDFFIVVK